MLFENIVLPIYNEKCISLLCYCERCLKLLFLYFLMINLAMCVCFKG